MSDIIKKEAILTKNAPIPIGAYSQAIKVGQTVYISGQIPLDPATGKLVEESIEKQIERVFLNLQAICSENNSTLNDIVKLNVFLTDFTIFPKINEATEKFFEKPYPARSTVAVKALPLNVPLEIEAILVKNSS